MTDAEKIRRAKKELQDNFYRWQQAREERTADDVDIFEMDRRATVQLLYTIACLLLDAGIVPREIKDDKQGTSKTT